MLRRHIFRRSLKAILDGQIDADFAFDDTDHVWRYLEPFANPVYLLPLVEVLGGERTAETSIERAMAFYRGLGMHALKVRSEVLEKGLDALPEPAVSTTNGEEEAWEGLLGRPGRPGRQRTKHSSFLRDFFQVGDGT